MAHRLLQAALPAGSEEECEEILRECGSPRWYWLPQADGRVLLQALIAVERAEALTDRLTARLASDPGFSLLLLPVEAALPAVEETPPPEADVAKSSPRVSREELYEDVAAQTQLTPIFAAAVALSTVVAVVGLLRGDLAILIGAMVIAPLLGPNVALALAAVLGDSTLAARALRANGVGFAIAFGMACVAGLLFQPDPDLPQLALRASVHPADLLVACASGTAGVLAFTTGLPSAVIGVMVAVALLPPTVAAGLLLGAGHAPEAGRALLLLLVNVACVNAAGVATFAARKIRPRTWWEGERARKASRRALIAWSAALAVIGAVVVRVWLLG